MLATIGGLVVLVLVLIVTLLGAPSKPFNPAAMSRVVDKVYVGAWTDSEDEGQLKYYGIKGVLTLNAENRHSPEWENRYRQLGIAHKSIVIQDSTSANIAQHIPAAIAFVKANQPCLVHCTMGISRSSSVVIAYIMNTKHMGYDDALAYARQARPIINPNRSFESQLRAMERR